jgi:hypothetical protein
MRGSNGIAGDAHAMVAMASVAALVILGVADPAASPIFPPCLFRAATGWLCPGCGSARAIHALMHGDVRLAFQMNAGAVVALALVASDFIQGWVHARGGWMRRLTPAYAWSFPVAVVSFGVLRNVIG